MRSESSSVGIVPGEGLVARFGGVVVFLAATNAATDRILGAVRTAAEGERPGAAIAQRLASVVFAGGAEPPPFGVVAPTPDGTLVLLRGSVSAQLHGAEGVRTLSGERAFTWVDEIVRDPVRTVSIGAGNVFPLTPAPHTDLRDGVVPGGGFVLRAAVRKAGRKGVSRRSASGAVESRRSRAALPAAAPSTRAAAAAVATGSTPAPEATAPWSGPDTPSPAADPDASPAPQRTADRPQSSSTPEPPPTEASGWTAMPEPTGPQDLVPPPAGTAAEGRARPSGTTAGVPGPQAVTSDEAGSAADEQVHTAGRTGSDRRGSATDGAAPADGGSRSPALDSDPTAKAPPRPDPPRPLAWSQVPDAPATYGRYAPPTGAAHPPPGTGRMMPPRAGASPGRDARGRVALRKVQNTGTRVMPPVPPRTGPGALVLDGTAYPLDRPYVIGRGPESDASVKAAVAAPLVLPRDRNVSRVHAYVSVENGAVFVRDAGTGAGTFVAPPGTDEWARIGTDPTELPPGARVRISDRVLTYLPEPPR